MNRLTLTTIAAIALSLSLQAQTLRPARNAFVRAFDEPAAKTDRLDDPVALGHPLSYWVGVAAAQDPNKADLAFDAIVALGPAAENAVPELMRLVARPFEPIRLDTDTMAEIHLKLLDIHFRAGAVDGLGAIGPAAGPSAEAVIRWGLTPKVAAPSKPPASITLYVDLVAVDVLERMRAAGAVARFGVAAAAVVSALIASPDNERRKFAAAILSDKTVPIAAALMESRECVDRTTGLSLLAGMWPVVAREHLAALAVLLECMETAEATAAIRQSAGPLAALKEHR